MSYIVKQASGSYTTSDNRFCISRDRVNLTGKSGCQQIWRVLDREAVKWFDSTNQIWRAKVYEFDLFSEVKGFLSKFSGDV